MTWCVEWTIIRTCWPVKLDIFQNKHSQVVVKIFVNNHFCDNCFFGQKERPRKWSHFHSEINVSNQKSLPEIWKLFSKKWERKDNKKIPWQMEAFKHDLILSKRLFWNKTKISLFHNLHVTILWNIYSEKRSLFLCFRVVKT